MRVVDSLYETHESIKITTMVVITHSITVCHKGKIFASFQVKLLSGLTYLNQDTVLMKNYYYKLLNMSILYELGSNYRENASNHFNYNAFSLALHHSQ